MDVSLGLLALVAVVCAGSALGRRLNFSVLLLLVVKGLSLPWLVRMLGVRGPDMQADALSLAALMDQATAAGIEKLRLQTGPDKLEGVLRRHPDLTIVVAHLGAPEYSEFLTLAERYPRVHLDTTMVFTDFFEKVAAFPSDLLPRLVDLPDRVVLGSDFPNIPYAYAHQLEALERLREREPRLDDDWLRAVCWFNGHRLIGD